MLQTMRDTAASAQQVADTRSRAAATLHANTTPGGGGGGGDPYAVTDATIDTVQVSRGTDFPVTATVENSAGEARTVTVQVYVGDTLAGSHTQELPGPDDVLWPDGEQGTTTTDEVLVLGGWKNPYCAEGAGLHEVTVKVAGSDASHVPGNVSLQEPQNASRTDICGSNGTQTNPLDRIRELVRSNPTAAYAGGGGFLLLFLLFAAI